MRNPFSDLRAVIASPVTAALAETFAEHSRIKRSAKTHPFGLAVFMCASWALDSANRAEGTLHELGADWFAREAAAAGQLGVRAVPTRSQFDHAVEHGGGRLVEGLRDALVLSTAELAPRVGLLARSDPDLLVPRRESALQADGTVFHPYSDVYRETIDGESQIVGSAATDPERARVSERHHGKKGGVATGLPAVAFTAHGGLPYQRLITYVDVYRDFAEQPAAFEGLARMVEVYGSRVQLFNYDRLLDGGVLRRIAQRLGLPGVVEMKPAQQKHHGIQIPVAHQRPRGDHVKTRARTRMLAEVTHDDGGAPCPHQLHALDGALRVTRPGMPPRFDSPLATMTSLERVHTDQGWQLPAQFEVPCPQGSFTWSTDFTTRLNRKSPLLNQLRPYPEAHPDYDTWAGWRNNVESVFAATKKRLPYRRASSWSPERFLMRFIAAAATINTTAWDVHDAQHTTIAQRSYDQLDRATTA